MLSIIIPAYNEASVIRDCLHSLHAQTYSKPLEIIVAANGCSDDTAEIARSYQSIFQEKGYDLTVLEIAEGNKNNALNQSDAIAKYANRLYLDADVVCETKLLEQLIDELHTAQQTYASGTLEIQQGDSFASRCYGTIWKATPYIRDTVPGCGCYAVNAAGRKLWGDFPKIHPELSVNDSKRIHWDISFIKHILSNPLATLIFASIYGISAVRVSHCW